MAGKASANAVRKNVPKPGGARPSAGRVTPALAVQVLSPEPTGCFA